MRKLSETVAHLASMRAAASPANPPTSDRLRDLTSFGSNPGNLAARIYVPEGLPDLRPLVVVLHGCLQTATAYDSGSGWSRLADEHGFAVLFPEQRRANNPNLCFNWFLPADNRRDQGEAFSISQMVAAVVRDHRIDPARVFVTGLSAGGAMTSVMLATYPELFAGGAVIAGLPYGCASNAVEAFAKMRGGTSQGAPELGDLVRQTSDHQGPWPTVSVWHGSADTTVNPLNADAIVAQWRSIHGVDAAPCTLETIDGHVRRVWRDSRQRAVVEDYRIAAMGHGTPLATGGDEPCGIAGPYMLEAGISSTRRIAAFWGLTGVAKSRKDAADDARTIPPEQADEEGLMAGLSVLRSVRRALAGPPPMRAPTKAGVRKIIEDALRSAGWMR